MPRRGRPPKYGSPSQVVAVTLPSDVVEALRRMHSDVGWAIVSLVRRSKAGVGREAPTSHADLVDVGAGQSLIVVNPDLLSFLPGVQMVPLSPTQAFLALEPGRGMADLELAVVDHLDQLPPASAEARAVVEFRAQLRRWRNDRHLAFQSRSIILVTKAPATSRRARR